MPLNRDTTSKLIIDLLQQEGSQSKQRGLVAIEI